MKNLVFYILLFLSKSAESQLIIDWQRNTNLTPFGEMNVKTDNADNPVVVRGTASSSGFIQVGTCVTKYDTDGNQLWSIEDEEFFDDFGFGMEDFDFDADNNILIGGIEMSTEDFYTHSMLIKLAPNGTELWRTNLSPIMSWSESIQNLVVAEDGSIFATAVLYFENVTTLAQALVKISPSGNVEWTNFGDNAGFAGLALDNEGMLYTTGYENIRQYNQDGELMWSVPMAFSDNSSHSVNAIQRIIKVEGTHLRIPTIGNQFDTNQNRLGLIAGNTDGSNFTFSEFDVLEEETSEFTFPRSFELDEQGNTYVIGNVSYGSTIGPAGIQGGKGGSTSTGLVIVKLNSLAVALWQFTEFYGELDLVNFPVASTLKDGDLIVVFNGGSVPTSAELVYSLDTSTGDINWTQTNANTSEFTGLFPQSVALSADGALYLSGNGTLGESLQLAYLNKYQFEEDVVTVEDMIVEKSHPSLYPNPVQNKLNIINTSSYSELRIIDASGRLVLIKKTQGQNEILIETETLEAGLYQLILLGDSNTVTKSFIKN